MSATALKAGWIAAFAFFALLVAQPLSVETQFVLACCAILGMIGIWRFGRRSVWRHVMLAFAIAVIARYVYWRTTSTLPPLSEPMDFVPGLLLYMAEMYCVLMAAISFFVIADPLRRRPSQPLPDDVTPTVDVLVPSYNEDTDLLAVTLAAALAMDYPKEKVRVYLLDDGATDQKRCQKDVTKAREAEQRRQELMQLCENLGAIYHARQRNEHAKAGNLNAGLAISTGELVVVFDADHAPAKSFLRDTVGHFRQDPKLFLVQTPHFFLNPDPVEKNLATFDQMPSENEMFYSVLQRGLDKWNASFFCGSAAVLRRSALETVGGFSGQSITEDCETALDLHAQGWNSRYVDKPLIAGLQPENMVSFIGQRSRWCQGMVQILILKNPLFRRGLTLAQRICYLSSSLFWLFPLSRMAFVFAPLLYIFFSLEIYEASIKEFISYTLLYLIVSTMLQNYLYGRVRWPWVSELYEYIQGVFLSRAIVAVILQPRKPTFNVTAKGQNVDEDHISQMARPLVIVFSILLAGLGMVVYRLATEAVVNDLLIVVGMWNLFNLVLAGAAIGAVAERKERRRSQRLRTSRPGILEIGSHRMDVAVEDVSTGGLSVRSSAGRLPFRNGAGMFATLEILADGRPNRVPVVFRRSSEDAHGICYGLEFQSMTAANYRVIAELMYSDARNLEDFRISRRRGQTIFGGTKAVLSWAFVEPWRAGQIALADYRKRAAQDEDERGVTQPAYRGADLLGGAPEPASAAMPRAKVVGGLC